jgi:hypothetical protein
MGDMSGSDGVSRGRTAQAACYDVTMDDSPPPFIVFYSPLPAQRAYRQALDLVEHVHHVLLAADSARYQIKDQLERVTTALALGTSRAANEVRNVQWRTYRGLVALVNDCIAFLDILGKKGCTSDRLEPARECARQLMAELLPLALLDN